MFYGLSVALDKISLALTSDRHAKAKKGLTIAHERLLEIKAMREAGKLDKAQKSADNYAATMDVVAAAIEQPETNPEKEAELVGEQDAELAEITGAADDVTNSLNADVAVDSELTEKQKARIEKINEKIARHQKAIAQLEDRKSKLGQNLFGDKLKETTEQHAKLEYRELRAQQAIVDAEEAIGKAFDAAPNIPRGQELLINANSHLTTARSALAGKKFGEAYGQANAAFHIAKAMIKKSEQLQKREEKKAQHEEKQTEKKMEHKEKQAEKENKSDMGRSEEEGNPAQKVKKSEDKAAEPAPASPSGGY